MQRIRKRSKPKGVDIPDAITEINLYKILNTTGIGDLPDIVSGCSFFFCKVFFIKAVFSNPAAYFLISDNGIGKWIKSCWFCMRESYWLEKRQASYVFYFVNAIILFLITLIYFIKGDIILGCCLFVFFLIESMLLYRIAANR